MRQDQLKVLLVDDDEFAYQVVELDLSQIEGAHFSVHWKSSYETGIEALRSNAFDVCLLDFQLGNQSGLELLREAVAAGCRVPIIMLTAQGRHDTDIEAMRAGASDYLVKGEFGPEMLERALRYAIERSRTLEALRESQERYALVVAGANDGLWDWKLPSQEVYFSPRWKEILGYEDQDLTNGLEEWYQRVHPEDLARLKSDVAAHVEGSSAHFENEHRILHKDGTFRWVVSRGLAVRNAKGEPMRFAGSQRDVTQSRGHDPLTGLPNRVLYLDRLSRAIARSKRRTDCTFAVLFLDLDRFKIVNDSLGHVVGDDLLVSIARRIETCVRTADTVARLGGDEFTILLEDLEEPEDATRVASRIQEVLSTPFSLSGREVFTSVSIGIALGSSTYDRPEELLRDADTAMYRAKAGGKARHEVFDKEMHNRAIAMLQLETELRRAVECQNLQVLYQPIISVQTGRIVSLEALVRWAHPIRGLIPPDEFIPLAEETGLIVQIDRWVMREACTRMKEWLVRFGSTGLSTVAVNVSKKQLSHNSFLEEIDRTLTLTSLAPEALSLEITESVIMDNAELAKALLNNLRLRHIHLSMDDFGTGYSSLSYLHTLPFASIKIDRSFIKLMGKEGATNEIVRAIVALARSLKLRVTAEGVETAEQLALVRELGCDTAQGYLFAKPLEAEACERLLDSGPVW